MTIPSALFLAILVLEVYHISALNLYDIRIRQQREHHTQKHHLRWRRFSCSNKGLSSTSADDEIQSKIRLEASLEADIFGHIFGKGNGQIFGDRTELHDVNARRPLSDIQMWTHAFFIVDGVVAAMNSHYEVLLLTLITSPLSFIYHWTYEKPGSLAMIESAAAKCCFIYGILQISNAPNPNQAEFESALALTTTFIFVITNIKKELYDPWHCLMHVFPPIWVAIVACSHSQLYDTLKNFLQTFN